MKVMKKSELMSIQEDIEINMHCPVVGFQGTPLGFAFDYYIKTYGIYNAHFICSLVYNLGMMHGKREERARRKRAEQACRTNKAGTAGEADRLRESINRILDSLNVDELKGVDVFLCTLFEQEGLNERQD